MDIEPLPEFNHRNMYSFLNLVTKYEVKVVTADDIGDGTDANVHITLYGERGDSGRRMLKKSKEGQNKFEAGNVRVDFIFSYPFSIFSPPTTDGFICLH